MYPFTSRRGHVFSKRSGMPLWVGQTLSLSLFIRPQCSIHVTPVFVVKRARRIGELRGFPRFLDAFASHDAFAYNLFRITVFLSSFSQPHDHALSCPFAVLAPARIRTVGGFYTAAYRTPTLSLSFSLSLTLCCIYRATLTTASQLHTSGRGEGRVQAGSGRWYLHAYYNVARATGRPY